MFLYFDGCSHTWGDDLEDNLNERFSTLVSNHFLADHENGSRKGSSNDEITERTLTFIKNNPCDIGVVVMAKESRFIFNPVYKTIMPGLAHKPSKHPPKPGRRWAEKYELSEIFFSKLYTHRVGATQFYKNRFILEHAFKKKGIPLILLQWTNLKYEENKRKPGECVYKDYCEGSLPLITSWVLPSLLGLPKDKEYFYSEHQKQIAGHPNKRGHRKIADLIIELIDTH